MKKLLKLPILLITLLLIFSCGRNAKTDVEKIQNLFKEMQTVNDDENNEKMLELISEYEEIFSYYVNDADSDEISLFIKLFNDEVKAKSAKMKDKEDLEKTLKDLKAYKKLINGDLNF